MIDYARNTYRRRLNLERVALVIAIATLFLIGISDLLHWERRKDIAHCVSILDTTGVTPETSVPFQPLRSPQ
ncbi:MAG: hypothetical protein NHG36_17335 [Chromatiaceae bacterium]|nr:hypothetical protein [Candidatus Thioaporhodococcus sediminis]